MRGPWNNTHRNLGTQSKGVFTPTVELRAEMEQRKRTTKVEPVAPARTVTPTPEPEWMSEEKFRLSILKSL